MAKYVCMKEDCDFLSIDKNEAMSHMEEHGDHLIAEVSEMEDGVSCSSIKSPVES